MEKGSAEKGVGRVDDRVQREEPLPTEAVTGRRVGKHHEIYLVSVREDNLLK